VDDLRTLTLDGNTSRAKSDEKGYAGEIAAFLRAVRGEAPLEVTVQDGVRATVMALRAIESVAAGSPVAVDWTSCQ